MSIGTFHELNYFDLESMEVAAHLQEAHRIIERQQTEELRIQKQSKALNALNQNIDEAWAEVQRQQFALLSMLAEFRLTDSLNASIRTVAPIRFNALVQHLSVFSKPPHLEWVDLAVGEPKVLEMGNWIKLMLLLTLDSIFKIEVDEAKHYLTRIQERLVEWDVKERSGFLKLFAQWLHMSNTDEVNDKPALPSSLSELMKPSVRKEIQATPDGLQREKKSSSADNRTFVGNTDSSKTAVILVDKIDALDSEKDDFLVNKYKPLTEPMEPVRVVQPAAVIQTVLDEEFPWMRRITSVICADLVDNQRYQLAPALVKPIVLVGPSGLGKTHYLQRLADLMAVPSLILSVGGMADNMTLKGSSRSWSSARPSVISDFINQKQCPNPVVILDEIEKAGTGRNNGNVYDTLLQLLEIRNAGVFYDECLLASIDLSRVTYLATANSTKELPLPIRDRVRVLRVPEPTADHMLMVAYQLWWAYWGARQIPVSEMPPIDDRLLKKFLKGKTSVRQVKRVMDSVISNAKEKYPLMRLH